MTEASETPTVDIDARLNALEARMSAMESKMGALEEFMLSAAPSTEPTLQKPAQKTRLSGSTFKVAGKTYRLKYPHFDHDGKSYNEAYVLENKEMQKMLVEGQSGIIERVSE